MVKKRENAGLRHDIYKNNITEELARMLKCEQDMNGGGVILLHNTTVVKNRVEFDYCMSKQLTELFDSDFKFFYEYMFDINLDEVPTSILNVPFVMNLMPLIWLSDSVLYVKTLDRTFYESLNNIKKGFERVYPKVSFKGKLVVESLECNKYEFEDITTIFFTGGADATASLINNIAKNPQPFYILGADVSLRDIQNIEAAQRDVVLALDNFGMSCNFIKSSVRFFYDGVRITNVFEEKLKDSWWHGAQHSIGMLSLMAPYAFARKIKTCIIAASFTKEAEGKINCVSFPFIDNELKFGSTNCYHDGYDMTRQEKINLIAQYGKETNANMFLRVCFSPRNGSNCNKCEKCMRTFMSLKAAGVDPNQYGFCVDHETYLNVHKYLSENLLYHTAHWKAIQAEYRKNKEMWKYDEDVAWILKFKFNSLKIYKNIAINKLKRIIFHRG